MVDGGDAVFLFVLDVRLSLSLFLSLSLLGAIRKGRPQNFWDLGPSPPLSAFWLDL